jgi:hypothetical protein
VMRTVSHRISSSEYRAPSTVGLERAPIRLHEAARD